MLVYKIITIIAFIVACVWAFNARSFESICSTLGALSAVVFVFFVDVRQRASKQSLDVAAGATGIQVGRDAKNIKVTNRN